jgi:hypothetical protein
MHRRRRTPVRPRGPSSYQACSARYVFPIRRTLPTCPTDAALPPVLRRLETLEQVLHIHCSFLATAVKGSQRHIDGADHGLGLPRTVPQTFPLIEQGGLPVEARVVERPPDFFQRQTELSADEDLLQPKQVRVDVNAVTGRCPGSGYEEPYGIVIPLRLCAPNEATASLPGAAGQHERVVGTCRGIPLGRRPLLRDRQRSDPRRVGAS